MTDRREYVQDAIDTLFALWVRRTSLYGALIFLLLSFLDFTVFPEHFRLFLGYRIAIALFLLLLFALAQRTMNRTALRFFYFAGIFASAATIEAMILHTGADHSLYSMGMILLAVSALAFVPADLPFHAAMAGTIYGVYLLPIIMTQDIDDLPVLFVTNLFMCAIILTVLVFRYMALQTMRQQLAAEYELILSASLLQESEQKQRLLLQNANDAIYVHALSPDAPGQFLEANDRACSMLGYTREEMLAMEVPQIDIPEQSQQVASIIQQLIETGSAMFETEHVAKDGRRVPVEVSTRLFHLHGQPTVMSVVRDTTERKKLEEQLKDYQTHLEKMVAHRTAELEKTIAQLEQEMEARKGAELAVGRSRRLLDGVFEGIQDGIVVLDTEQNIITSNSAFRRYFGGDFTNALKRNKCFEVYHGTAERCKDCMSAKAMSEKTIQTQTISCRREDGTTLFFEVFTFPLHGEQGEIKGVIQHLRDITERKKADEALKESEERFKRLLDSAPIAVSIINRAGIVEYANRKHAEIMGYDLPDIPTLERWWSQAYPDEKERSMIRTGWDTLIQRLFQGETISSVYRRVVCKDGTSKELELNFKAAGETIIVTFSDITERMQAEKKLQESELRHRTLFEKASEGIAFIDERGSIVAANESFARMHGYRREEILTSHINDLDAGRSFGKDPDILHRVMAGESLRFEVEHNHAAGHTFQLEVLASLIELNNQRLFLGFHHDITDRKKNEKELEEKEARMRAMLESFDGLIYICSPDYRIEFMNENLIRRTGRAAVGEKCYAVMNNRNTICPWCVNERVFKGETVRYEIQSPIDKQWYQVVNTPIHHDNGSISKLAMFLDITETKKADIALKESERRYRRLVGSVTDYIYTVTVHDSRPGTTEHGEGCFAVTGYTADQYEADPDLWYRMVYVSDRDSVLEQARTVIAGGKIAPLEHRIVHRNGTIRWVRHIIAPLFDKNRKLLSFDGLISDITEKKLLELQLEKARILEEENLKVFSRQLIDVQEEERRSIARELHDEIGQSLTGLKLSVENIADSLPSEQADDMKAIEVSLGELISLVRSISLDLRPAMLDDFGLVNTMRWYFERYTLQTGISVDFTRTGADMRFGPHKEIALYRITQESLTNAARYAGVKNVLVELIIAQDTVTLRIADKGRGFDAASPSVSVSSGLSIMRERSILLKGTFSLNSVHGKGTEITVSLPLHDTEDGQGGSI